MAGQGCWDEVLGQMPEATLSVRRAAFRRLQSGQAVTVEDIAAEVGLRASTAREAVELVVSVGMAETDDGVIVGMDGLTTRQTQHSLLLGTVPLWTWCAYDIVGIAAALQAEATGRTQCGSCGKGIEVLVQAGEPRRSSVVGWLPDESCTNVMKEFCPMALLFCSTSHLNEWRVQGQPGSGESLDLQALAARGRRDWSQLVA